MGIMIDTDKEYKLDDLDDITMADVKWGCCQMQMLSYIETCFQSFSQVGHDSGDNGQW